MKTQNNKVLEDIFYTQFSSFSTKYTLNVLFISSLIANCFDTWPWPFAAAAAA